MFESSVWNLLRVTLLAPTILRRLQTFFKNLCTSVLVNICDSSFSAHVQTDPGAHPASYTMGTGSFPGVKRPGRGVDHPPPSSARVKERVELYLYSPSGPSWPVLGRTLPFIRVHIHKGVACRGTEHMFVCKPYLTLNLNVVFSDNILSFEYNIFVWHKMQLSLKKFNRSAAVVSNMMRQFCGTRWTKYKCICIHTQGY
jgi:hypothetical protein